MKIELSTSSAVEIDLHRSRSLPLLHHKKKRFLPKWFYTGCPYSCVKTAPDAFSFMDEYGYGSKARATSQGGVRLDKERSSMQVAVKQCPRKCIHYVTPAQREILEELLHNILTPPLYDSGEMDCLKSLITKAKYENGRYMSKFEN